MSNLRRHYRYLTKT